MEDGSHHKAPRRGLSSKQLKQKLDGASDLIAILRNTLGKMEVALGTISDGIVWTDESGVIQWSNVPFDRLVRRPRLDILGEKLSSCLPLVGDGANGIEHLCALLRSGVQLDCTLFEFRRRESDLFLEVEGSVARTGDHTRSLVFVIRDVTERVRREQQLAAAFSDLEAARDELQVSLSRLQETQDQLLQAGKMAAIGQLAGGIAHEMNNPVGIIVGFAQGMEGRVPDGDPLRLPVASILREALRCKTLVQELLTFSRLPKKTLEQVDVSSLVASTEVLLQSRARAQRVDLAIEVPEVELMVSGNRTHLQQVIVNLGNNALDAITGRGALTIRVFPRGSEVWIEVEDTGSGIADDVRPHIFEPFFTTKEPGKGTGLGLSLVYEMVRVHGGQVDLRSEVGRGTTMTVRLPRTRS